MIEIKPVTENFFRCPECHAAEPRIVSIDMHSVYTLGECKCRYCELEFYQTLPIGHCINDHVSIGKSNGKIYPGVNENFWLIETLKRAHRGVRNDKVSVRKIVNENRKEVIVLNTLDYLYGHVLLKLFNYQHHLRKNPELGLIVIVPKAFEWLVPAEASEAWIVDLPLGELAYEHHQLKSFFNEEFKRFDKVFFSMAWSHPDLIAVDIKRMTGIAPFNLEYYTTETPTITFVLREDRWWLKSQASYALYRLGRRFKNFRKTFYGLVSQQQEDLARDAIKAIRKAIPQVKFFITGIGEAKGFDGLATDTRTTKVNEEKELEWCRIYSKSHVVIGFHGSNMLLPTAFAAGCVEILPEDRYGNIMQDIAVRYSDRRQSFFYRFADQYSKPSTVASKVISMIRDYDEFNRNMCRNQYPQTASTSTDLFVLQR